MSPLRCWMIEDMNLAGLATSTGAVYAAAVRKLAAHYGRSPDDLTEEDARSYLLIGLRQRGVARASFKAWHYGIQFFLSPHTRSRVATVLS
jgi:integrase/recombinase XerD